MTIKKIRNIVILLIALTLVLSSAVWGFYRQAKPKKEIVEKKVVKEVEVRQVKNIVNTNNNINLVGRVMPNKKVSVVSLTQGTAISVPFNTGDKVEKDQVLVYLSSSSLSTQHNNLQTSYINMINNLEAVKRTSNESVRQAEIGVEKAKQSVEAAKIALQSAQDNLDNTTLLQDKKYVDQHNQAIISFYSFLNSVENALNQVNYIIHVDEGPQLPGINQTISARDYQQLNYAKQNYSLARDTYNNLKEVDLDIDNVREEFKQLISLLQQTKITVDYTVGVLNNTVSSDSLSKQTLVAQKNAFISLRSSVVNTQVNAQKTLDALEMLDISSSNNIDSLQNAILAAQKNLELSQVAYNNALAVLDGARQAKRQQILAAQSSVDAALGQLNLSSNQISDLSIKAPISGQITDKFVEVGADIRVGQKIAEISQVQKLKIEVNLSVDDIDKIKLGEEVKIAGKLKGIINLIAPSADEITKKIRVEILFDNDSKSLIPGTFVNVSIPVVNQKNKQINYIPLSALNVSQGDRFVYTSYCKDKVCQAEKRKVKVGEIENDMVAIISGLKPDDYLIVAGNKRVKDGEIIKVKKDE